jgi:hypothetical protein
MARPNWVLALGIFIVSGLGTAVAVEPPAIFEMGFSGLRAAELAPNEQQFAALAFQITKPGVVPVEIQIWDFRKRTLVRDRHFETNIPSKVLSTAHIRYSADGVLLAVYVGGGTVHVFRASDLQQLNQIPLELSSAEVSGFEISPSSHVLAVRRSLGRGGDLRLYDLDSGKELRDWPISEGFLSELYRVSPVAWRGDGGLLATTAPDDAPCTRFGGTIYVFDPNAAKPVKLFRVHYLPGSLAFGTDEKLYVASMTCGGYFAHWTTDLPVFEARSGRQIGKIPAQQVGIRRTIAVAQDKTTLLAYADREKTTFEGFEDTLKINDAQWQVLDASTGHVFFSIPATEYDESLLSKSGHFLLNVTTDKLRIFSVPSR